MLDLRPEENGVVFRVKVQPRASKNGLAGELEGALKVRLTAPPVDGAANEACCKFFAELFKIAKSQVEIISGHTGRNKIIRISGVTLENARLILMDSDKC